MYTYIVQHVWKSEDHLQELALSPGIGGWHIYTHTYIPINNFLKGLSGFMINLTLAGP